MLPTTKKIIILDIVLLAAILIVVMAMPTSRNSVMAGAPPAFGPVNSNNLEEASTANRADLQIPAGARKFASSVLSETYPDVLPPLAMEPAMLKALVEQATYLRRRDLPAKMASGITKGELLKTVEQLKDIPVLEPNALFQNFEFYAVKTGLKQDRVRMTGYYTPLISASKTRTEEYQYPLLERPGKGETTPSPSAIWSGALDHKAMAWVKSRKEVENAQLQGSCLIEFPDGSRVHLGFGGSVKGAGGKYVFFTQVSDEVLGCGSFPLTAGYSVAVDPRYIPIGSTLLAELPDLDAAGKLKGYTYRILFAQDRGGAIKTTKRLDLYCGIGQLGLQEARRINSFGRLWLLLPKR